MGKNNKKHVHPITNSKYFKWGLTAFLVILATLLSIFVIYNGALLASGINSLFKMTMPIIDGLIVAYILSPMIDKIENKIFIPFLNKHDIPINDKKKTIMRSLAILITLTLVVLLIILFIKTVIPQLIESVQSIIYQMPVYLDNLIAIGNKIVSDLDIFQEKDVVSIVEHYYEDIMQFLNDNILPSVKDWARTLSNSLFSFLGAVWDLFIGFFIAVYLLFSKERFKGQLKKLTYAIFSKERANLLISDVRYIDKTFLSFVGGKIVDSLVIGLLCFIVLTLFSIPYTLLISVIIGVTNIIPFFGPFIGAIPSAIFLVLIDPVKALYFIIIVFVLQQFDGNVLGPMILGNSTGLAGFWVIFSITLFGGIWGIPGMFLGVPTFACIYAWIKRKMKMSLTDKELSTKTEDYINLQYIGKNNEYYDHLEVEKTDIEELTNLKNNQHKRMTKYINLSNNEEQENKGIQIIDKIKELSSDIIKKNDDDSNDNNTNN